MNKIEKKYSFLYALGNVDAQAWKLHVDSDDNFLDLKKVMEKLDEYFILKNRNVEKKISLNKKRKDVSVLY